MSTNDISYFRYERPAGLCDVISGGSLPVPGRWGFYTTASNDKVLPGDWVSRWLVQLSPHSRWGETKNKNFKRVRWIEKFNLWLLLNIPCASQSDCLCDMRHFLKNKSTHSPHSFTWIFVASWYWMFERNFLWFQIRVWLKSFCLL